MRGNVNTRLAKLDGGEFDAIILACAGLIRLGFEGRIGAAIDPDLSLPAAGQGAVGIEFRETDQRVSDLLGPLHHEDTATRVLAERAVVRRLDGGCDVPIAAFAEFDGDGLRLRARVGATDGTSLLEAEARGADPEQLGESVAEMLLSQGAEDLIRAARG